MIFNKVKIVTVSDNKKKEQIQEVLAEHNIMFKIKVKEILHKNPLDAALIGTFGNNKIKFTYSFYVEKENLDVAHHLLKGSNLL